jgi:hypothetical protein
MYLRSIKLFFPGKVGVPFSTNQAVMLLRMCSELRLGEISLDEEDFNDAFVMSS